MIHGGLFSEEEKSFYLAQLAKKDKYAVILSTACKILIIPISLLCALSCLRTLHLYCQSNIYIFKAKVQSISSIAGLHVQRRKPNTVCLKPRWNLRVSVCQVVVSMCVTHELYQMHEFYPDKDVKNTTGLFSPLK